MNKINYAKELEKLTEEIKKTGKIPRLLLHACCAPCSSSCLEYLTEYFDITVFYYNPNIYPPEEFRKRAEEEKRLIDEMEKINPISLVTADFDPEEFYSAVNGLEACPEGGERCRRCFRLRLSETARYAREHDFDYFTTTLTLSPLKDSQLLNKEGERAGELYGVKHLPSDFKKKGGYQRSIELSKLYGLYRQDYCGCIFSLRHDLYINKNKGEESHEH